VLRRISLPTRADRLFVAFLAALALARVTLLLTSQGNVHGDEATVGVMAIRLLERGEKPVSAYNAPYNGGSAVMAWLAAAPFAVFGPSERALKAVPLTLSLLAVLFAYLLVRAARGPWPALTAAVVYGTAVTLLRWSLDARGAYAECQALAPLAFWLLYRRCAAGASASVVADIGLGAMGGFGFYLLALFAPAAATCLLFVLLRRSRVLAGAVRWMLGFAAGSLPVWAYRLQVPAAPREWGSPRMLWRMLSDTLPRALTDLTLYRMPDFRWLPNGLEAAFLVVTLAAVVWGRRTVLRAYLRSGGRPSPPLEAILGAHLLAFLAALSLYRESWYEARYVLFAEPTLSVLAGLGVYEALSRPSRAWRVAMAALLAAVMAGRVRQYVGVLQDRALHGYSGRSEPAMATAIGRFLEDRRIRVAHTGEWDLRWRVAFITRDGIDVRHLHRAWLRRVVSQRYLATVGGPFALILEPGENADVIERLAGRRGLGWERHRLAGRDVYVIGPAPAQ
jgi:hypothetical protein